MAKWAHSNIQDGGADKLRALAATANQVKLAVVKAYAGGDSYATVNGNICAAVSLVPGDITSAGAAGAARVATIAAKASVSITASSGASPNLHIALVDTVNSAVLLVTDETSDQQLYSGNTFDFPSWTYTVQQPT